MFWSTSLGGAGDINFGDILSFDWNVPRSWVAWIKTSGADAFQGIVSRRLEGGGVVRGWSVQRNTNGRFGATQANNNAGNGLTYYSQNGALTIGVWTMIGVRILGTGGVGGMQLFKNGISIPLIYASAPVTQTILNGAPCRIGAMTANPIPGRTAPFVGEIGPVGIWNRALSNTEFVDVFRLRARYCDWRSIPDLAWLPTVDGYTDPGAMGAVIDRVSGQNGTIEGGTIRPVYNWELPNG
ncbi:MAG: hypothetical protein KIT41_14220 [Pyrinomonadaceae bacterium]|nr:hypothetical protein [Pyrinomonadaceae bacterium]